MPSIEKTLSKLQPSKFANCGIGEYSRESLGLHGDQTSQF